MDAPLDAYLEADLALRLGQVAGPRLEHGLGERRRLENPGKRDHLEGADGGRGGLEVQQHLRRRRQSVTVARLVPARAPPSDPGLRDEAADERGIGDLQLPQQRLEVRGRYRVLAGLDALQLRQ